MKRRKLILGAGSAALGGSALLGSGAFSRVESQRSVTIEVAEDPDAYLGMDGCPDSPNQSYTNIDEDGHLEIDMTPENPTDAGGEGVNSDSRTWFDSVFQLCNQGKEQVCVYIEDDDDWPEVGADDSDRFEGDRRVDFYLEGDREESIIGFDNAFHLPLGECVCVGLRTNTKGLSEDDRLLDEIDEEITIVADVGGFCKDEEAECADIEAEIDCYTEATAEDDEWPVGTTFEVENIGDAAPDDDSLGFAILDSPDEEGDIFENAGNLDPGETRLRDVSTGVPLRGIVFWTQEECDPEDVPAPTRDEWTANENFVADIDDDALDPNAPGNFADLTPERLDDVRDVGDFSEFEAEFDPDDPDIELDVPEDAFIAEIDFSEFNIETTQEWEHGDVGIPQCNN